MDRRNQLIARMLSEVDDWYSIKNTPMRIQILSAKYGRSMQPVGGFSEVLQELIRNGRLKSILLDTGARLVYPATVSLTTTPRGKE